MNQSKQTNKLVKQLIQETQQQEAGRQRVLKIVKDILAKQNNK